MALKANYTLYSASAGRFFGNYPINQYTENFADVGSRMNRFCMFSKLSAQPRGYLAPYAWQMPIVGGDMSSTNNAREDIYPFANMAGGINGLSTTGLSISAFNAQLDRLIDLIASATLALTANNPDMAAAAALIASATLQITSNADIGAIIEAIGSSNMSILQSCFLSALADLQAQAGGPEALSPQGLANAVWSKLLEDANSPGTMGELAIKTKQSADNAFAISASK